MRKKSKQVRLILLGTTAILAGCDNEIQQTSSFQDVKQEYYTSRADCEHDWGKDTSDCTPATSTVASNTTSTTHGGYYGPRYYWDRSIGYPVAVGLNGETRVLRNSYLSKSAPSLARSTSGFAHVAVSRGGFGGTAHGFSGGG